MKQLNSKVMVLIGAIFFIVIGLVIFSNNSNKPHIEIADVSYNGKTYSWNDDISTYLCMGIDIEGKKEPAVDSRSGGQADTILLVVVDNRDKDISLISINRNTMTEVDVYREDGDYFTTQKLQLCLQHAYGDGLKLSCERAASAVSKLFYNIPIDGYISVNMGGAVALNNAIGGVSLTVLEDITWEDKGVYLKKGEEKHLSDWEAYAYLRLRNVNEFDSASMRIERQKQYLEAFFQQVESKISLEMIKNLNQVLGDYAVTNMDWLDAGTKVLFCGLENVRVYSIPGETTVGLGGFEEFYVDEEAFYQQVLDIFYKVKE